MTKSNGRTRVDFAPGRTDAYVIVQTDGKPYPLDQGTVYEGKEGLERAQRRCEWLNWSERSKGANVYHHPREEAAARRAQQRETLLAAHRALREEERLGTAVAAQLRALRAELAREEAAAQEYESKAEQEGRPAKVRREMRQIAKAARARAQGLASKIADLEQGPAQPSRLQGGGISHGGTAAGDSAAGAGADGDEPGRLDASADGAGHAAGTAGG